MRRSRPSSVRHAFVSLSLALLPQAAIAQEEEKAARGYSDVAIAIDHRRQGSDDIVSPGRELEIASEMTFVTSRGAMAGVPALRFTDLGLLCTRVAYSPLPRVRLTGAASIVAKQPATIDEPLWQAAALGVQLNTSQRTVLALGFDVGPMLGEAGTHGSVGLGLQLRERMNDFVSWEGRVGGRATSLWYEADTREPFWFAEAGVSGEIQACWGPCDRRFGASWFAIDLAVPVVHHPGRPDADTGLALDPRTRLNVTAGSFINVSRRWDMHVTLAWIDRGDPEVPATQLPMLEGGFDQVQLAVGLITHLGFDVCAPGDRSAGCARGDD